MKTIAKWLVLIFMLCAATLAALRYAALPQTPLGSSDLTLGHPPSAPAQPVTARIECTGGLEVAETDISGDWYLTRDHPPCTIGFSVLSPVSATAEEIGALKRRPKVAFHVVKNGHIGNVKLLETSGSKTLDEKTLQALAAYTFPRHNCGVCRVSTQINVSFKGSVWVNE